jgi:sporulation protein YlmC with PRC-barrel domain
MKEHLLLMRHLLDVQLVDAEGERITKVDGVEVELRDGSRPAVSCLLIGPEPLARRVGPRIGRIIERITGGRQEVRIPWEDVQEIGANIRLRAPAHFNSAVRAQTSLAEEIVRKIPGSG